MNLWFSFYWQEALVFIAKKNKTLIKSRPNEGFKFIDTGCIYTPNPTLLKDVTVKPEFTESKYLVTLSFPSRM